MLQTCLQVLPTTSLVANTEGKPISVKGFTIIELVMVVILMAIMFVFVGPKLFGSSEVSAAAYQTRVISILRNLQVRAMQDTRSAYCFRMIFDNTNEQFGATELDFSDDGSASCTTSIDTANNNDNFYTTSGELAAEGIDLQARNASGALITRIDFDAMGRATPNTGDCDTSGVGCYIDLIGATSNRVCIEPEGYIHVGDCQQQ